MADLFASLLQLSWRGLALPCQLVESSGSQSIAEHGRVDRQGARLEGTGRNPYDFEIDVPCLNGLATGPQETWTNLFPETFESLIGFLEDRSTGELQHPLFGKLQCKAITWKISLSPDTRSGVIVRIHFRESDESDTAQAVGGASSNIALVLASAINLDATNANLPNPFAPPAGFTSFTDFANQISAIGDQVTLAQNQAFAKIDSVVASCNKIVDSAGAVGTTVGNSVARVVEAANQVAFAATAIKTSSSSKSAAVGTYKTLVYTTLGGLAAQLDNRVADLVTLNPTLAKNPVIRPQTSVRYYS